MGEDGDDGDDGSLADLAEGLDEGSAEALSAAMDSAAAAAEDGDDGGGSGEEEDPLELVHVDEDFFYMAYVMRVAAILHSLVSLAMLIAYYHLKVINFILRAC